MSKYFTIQTGLRGGYMPDCSNVIRCDTRRDLKAYLEGEARDIRDAEYIGCGKRAIAWLAAKTWREAQKPKPGYLPFVAEYRAKDQTHYPYGIFASVATRAEYLEAMADAD